MDEWPGLLEGSSPPWFNIWVSWIWRFYMNCILVQYEHLPGLNIRVPLRYAYSFGLKSKLPNFLRQDLSLLTPAKVGCSLSMSKLSWQFSRIFFNMLSAGMSVTSKRTPSWAKPKMKSGAQHFWRRENWSLSGSWLNAGRFFIKWTVLTSTADASWQVLEGFFRQTLRRRSQWQEWENRLWFRLLCCGTLYSIWLRMLYRIALVFLSLCSVQWHAVSMSEASLWSSVNRWRWWWWKRPAVSEHVLQ